MCTTFTSHPGALTINTTADIDANRPADGSCLEVGQRLRVRQTALIALDGLDYVFSVAGNVEIEQNDNLTSVSGLSNLASVGGDLIIRQNQNLLHCDAVAFAEGVAVTGTVLIENNAGPTTCP